jgi:transposase-like protein
MVSLCSEKSATPVTADRIHEILGSIGDSGRNLQPRTKRAWNRLSDLDRTAEATRYAAGETSTALAAEYGVAKSTILRLLRDNKIIVRRQPMRPEQVSEAGRLYESGLSLSQVAEKPKVNQETMRVAIIEAGVELRPPTGGCSK